MVTATQEITFESTSRFADVQAGELAMRLHYHEDRKSVV